MFSTKVGMLADIREQPWAKSLNVKFIYALSMKSDLKSYLNTLKHDWQAIKGWYCPCLDFYYIRIISVMRIRPYKSRQGVDETSTPYE